MLSSYMSSRDYSEIASQKQGRNALLNTNVYMFMYVFIYIYLYLYLYLSSFIHTYIMYIYLYIRRSSTDCSEIVSQKQGGKVLFKRELTVFDETLTEVKLTLWGDKAQAEAVPERTIIVVKSCKLTEFQGGRSLGITGSSHIMVNPEIDEARELYNYSSQFTDLPTAVNLSSTGGMIYI
jgi:hypothetical protein